MSFYPQAPLSIGKVLDGGFTLYRAVFKQILPLSFAVAVLAQLPQLVPYLMAQGGATVMVGLAIGFIVWFVLYMALYAGWIQSLDGLARGGAAAGIGAAFSAGMGKVVPVIAAAILYMLAIVIGSVLLLVPGLILLLSLMFSMFLVVLENQGAVDSLKNSHKLVWGRWWRTATIITVGGAIYFVALMLVMGVIGAAVGLSTLGGPTPEQAAAGVNGAVLLILAAEIVLNALLMPIMGSIMLVLFRDLQLRKSGADLAARAAAA